jgi:hypothetical protein
MTCRRLVDAFLDYPDGRRGAFEVTQLATDGGASLRLGGAPIQVKSHPIRFGSGEWTCVVGELKDGSWMVAVARWRDGALSEEYVWI